jgi:trigger factor
MSTLEKLENNMVKITIEVDAARFEEGMKDSYNKNKSKISLQGFRKGKAPRKIIEAQYGPEVFYDDAINFVIPDAYAAAVKEHELNVVSRPEVDVLSVKAGEPMSFTATVAVKPEVTLGQYKGVEIEKVNVDVTDEDIDADIIKVQEKNSRLIVVSDRPSKEGDVVTIDFEGFVDGVAFEGGKGEDYDLTLGSHTFIDTFEDQLIGKNLADEVDVNVTFPADYGKADLAGKPALFKVEIKDIKFKELPTLDDEFAKDVSEFDTLEEYKADIKSKLLTQKQENGKHEKENKVLAKVIENATMDVPKVMIEEQADQMLQDYSNRLSQQGLPFDMYLQYVGQTKEEFKASFVPQSEFNIKARLVLEAVGKAENFEITEADVEAELEKMATTYHIEIEKLKEVMADQETESIKQDIRVQKALDFMISNAVEV